MFNYSIVIRTLGNTGEKYLRMLQAIERQTVKPREVLVVIPEGYSLDHSLGNERVIYSKKGMVTQRAVGIIEAKGDYLLVLDDDLDFPPDFAEQMYTYLQAKQLDCVLAFGNGYNVQNENDNHQTDSIFKNIFQTLKIIRLAYTGQAFFSQRKSQWFDTIVSTGGHRTYVNCEDGLCQTGCFQCFFIKKEAAKGVQLSEESWLEQGSISSYAAYDDAVFFYKLFLQGAKIAYTNATDFLHLDAASGRSAKNILAKKRIRLYSISRNRTIFWYRFIWSNQRSMRSLIGGIYGMVNYAIYSTLINLYPKYWPAIRALWQGYWDAFLFIRKK